MSESLHAPSLPELTILQRLADDAESGSLRSLSEYEELFPEHREIVRREWAACQEATGAAGTLPRLGRFELIREIASGGQARVYEARDPAVADRRVALKVLRTADVFSPEALLRFRREAEVTSRLEHSGVVPIYEFGEQDGRPWIAMRFVDGETLSARLEREAAVGKLPTGAALQERVLLLERVARIVHAAHERGVVHRDLKPGNVMLEPSGQPVVLDFGLARAEGEDGAGLTRTGDVLGTPAYMAPEQIEGCAPVGRVTDVFALGVMLYEGIALERPFNAATPQGITRAILGEEPIPLRRRNSAVPRDLELVIATALAKRPDERYGAAQELADELQRVRELRPVHARPVSLRIRAVRWAQREPALAGLAAGLVATIATGLVITLVLLGRNSTLLTAEQAATSRATSKSAEAARALADYERLADGRRLDDLRREADQEHRVASAALPRLYDWHGRAEKLVARLPEHREFLKRLRERALPLRPEDLGGIENELEKATHEANLLQTRVHEYEKELERVRAAHPGEPKAGESAAGALETGRKLLAAQLERVANLRPWRFERQEDQWVHDLMAALVLGLEEFQAPRPGLNTMLRVRRWMRWSESLPEGAKKAEEAWKEASARIRDIAKHPCYSGLVIKPQEGLAPLGPDPASGLEEFAATFPGDAPTRDPATGRLRTGASTNVVFVLIPGGTCTIEGTKADLDPFFLGKWEITQGQYRELTYNEASIYRPGTQFPDGHVASLSWPVESCSWNESDQAMRRFGWMLPTEAQWEHACRAGTSTRWYFGDRVEMLRDHANFADATFSRLKGGQDSAAGLDDGYVCLAPIGTFLANPFGLFDMHGNVAEWCQDRLSDQSSLPRQGDGLRSGSWCSSRVSKGGSFQSSATETASSRGFGRIPAITYDDVGIRPGRRVQN